MDTKKFLTSLSLAIFLAAGNSGNLLADDTDIYLLPPEVQRDDAPNIVVLFDNSGSMESNTVSARIPYDATKTYAGSYTTDRIYWSTTSTGIPTATSNQWISPSKMMCSAAAFNLSRSAGAPGLYSSDRLAMFKIPLKKNGTLNSYGQWQDLEAPVDITKVNDYLVDCRGDIPAQAGLSVASTTPYSSFTGLLAETVVDPSYLWDSAYSSPAGKISIGSEYTTNIGERINWATYMTGTLYSGNWLNWNTDTTGVVSKTRIEVAQNALKSIVQTNANINLGIATFNRNANTPHGGKIVARVNPMSKSWRQALLDTVTHLRGYIQPNAAFGSGTGANYTPLSETMYEVYRYLSGLSRWGGGPYALDPNTNIGTNEYYPRPYPDVCAQYTTDLTRCAPYDYTTQTRTTVRNWLREDQVYVSPFLYQCQQAYIIIITDGEPFGDGAAAGIIDKLPGVAAGYSVDSVFAGKTTLDTTSRLDDLAGYMYNNDLIPDNILPGIQRALTYTIGFSDGISNAGLTLLKTTAAAGSGKFYDASDPNVLGTAIQAAIIDIQQTTSSFAAPSLSVNAFNKLFNRDEIYFALFKPSSSIQWDGNIKKLHLCNTDDETAGYCKFGEIVDQNKSPAIDPANLRIKDRSVSYWNNVADGGVVTDGGTGRAIRDKQDPTTRNVHTYLGSYADLPTTNNLFRISHTIDASNKLYAAAIADYNLLDNSGFINSIATTVSKAAANVNVGDTIHWMLGNYANGNTAERWPFGDPLHSRPVALTFGAEPDGLGGYDPNKPIIKLFVATNDGNIRIINDSTGEEEWSFVPKELLGNQWELSQDADGKHLYGADSSPTFLIKDLNEDGVLDPSAGDQAFMYVGMRRGGRNIYAFDLLPDKTAGPIQTNNSSGWLSPKLLWVIQGGLTTGYERLGQTWSTPQVKDIRVKCNSCTQAGDSEAMSVLIFGGGYNTDHDSGTFGPAVTGATSPFGDQSAGGSWGNAIYIADPATGERIWWVSSDTTANLVLSEMNFAIPSEPAAMDSNADGAVDRLYVGDTGGLLWRIDLGNQIDAKSAGDGGSTGYVFADLNCERTAVNARNCTATNVTQQSWRKVFYKPDVAQLRDSVYSLQPEYDMVVVSTGNRADPVDRLTKLGSVEAVHNIIFAIRDYNYSPGGAFNPSAKESPPNAIDITTLMDLTTDKFATTNQATLDQLILDLQKLDGWYVNLKETTPIVVAPFPITGQADTEWVGEKGLAKPVIYDNVVYVTTYTPANNSTAALTCASTEGLGKIYALGLFNATAVVDLNQDGTNDRVTNVGGGIPSELVTVIREGGVTGLVGTSGGAASPGIGDRLPRGKTFWYEE